MIIYPVGDLTLVTLDELKMVEGDNCIRYEILDSWQFIPDKKNCIIYPFKRFIESRYYERLMLKEKGDPLE